MKLQSLKKQTYIYIGIAIFLVAMVASVWAVMSNSEKSDDLSGNAAAKNTVNSADDSAAQDMFIQDNQSQKVQQNAPPALNVPDTLQEDNSYSGLADCLTKKGAVMYGTGWCGFCKKQKDLFGDSFKDIDYVNCDQDKDKCTSAGVRGYPTWKIAGKNYPGMQTFEKLSSLSGCELD
jgi:glutaredoxin